MLRHLCSATYILEGKDNAMNSDELIVPKFGSEREEAEWWDANPDFALKILQRAEAEGRLGNGSVARRMAALDAAKEAALKLDATDITLASKLAERRGIEREAYLKELVHTALLKEAELLDQSSAA
jgi:hypothetical protein